MLILFVPSVAENRKAYTDFTYPLKTSHSFSELKNESGSSLQKDILTPLFSDPHCTFMRF